MGFLPFLEIQGAAAMGKPAHDQTVFTDHLHAVNTQILSLLIWPPGNDQRPGNQRANIFRPAGLNRQHAQVKFIFFDDYFLAGRGFDDFR